MTKSDGLEAQSGEGRGHPDKVNFRDLTIEERAAIELFNAARAAAGDTLKNVPDELIQEESPIGSVVNGTYEFRHVAEAFWGVKNQKQFISDLMGVVKKHYGHIDQLFCGDNLLSIGKSLSFLHDAKFMQAFSNTITEDNTTGQAIIWRLYTFAWAAKSCLGKDGDFVECGVASGSSSRIMCDYVDFANYDKKLYLYDVFGKNEKFDGSVYFGGNDSIVEYIKSVFSLYPNVVIVPGFIPDTFGETAPEKISFLHIDLNNADAEIATLDRLFDRVVPGGIVLFDDYGFFGYASQKKAEDDWLSARGYSVLELPTGQGLLIK